MKKLFTLFFLFASIILSAQNGSIRGTVIEDESGLTVIGANVAVLNPLTGTSTDLDGKFSISIAPGTYDVQVSFISFQNITIKGVAVKSGEVNNLGTIRMKSSALALEEVVVTATATRRSEAALNTMKKKSVAMMDGISAQKMALTGDGNAAEAAQRVTGVSIEGGKYIYVRGLGDRYSKVTLNQMDIPGLDPDKNSLQMDIFPTNLIDNIIVSKNFTADMPADFTGGLMNVETKAFPDERILAVSAGIGFNPAMHFNQDFITYEGGETDYLGYDDGTRSLPSRARRPNAPTPIEAIINDNVSDEDVTNFVNSFDPTLSTDRQTSLLDYNLGVTYGDQVELGKKEGGKKSKLGYILSASYSNTYQFFDDVTFGDYQRQAKAEDKEMTLANIRTGQIGERSIRTGLLAGIAYKTKLSKIRLTVMHLQNGTSRAGEFDIEDSPEGGVGASGFSAESENLEYNERSLSNMLLHGKHSFNKSGWEIDWRLSPTLSISDDPDIRQTAFTFEPTDTFFAPGAAGNPSRIWRELEEVNLTSRIDVSKSYKLYGEDATLKFGLAYNYKERDYQILQYDMQFWRNQDWPNPDPATVLDDNNIFPNNPNGIYYQSGNAFPNPNAYNSDVNYFAAYASNEMDLGSGLRGIFGVRMEYFAQRHTGRDQAFASGDVITGNNLDDELVIDDLDFFPTVNLIYSLAEEQNLRLAYARTIARPSFKELSFAQIIDPLSNRNFNGALFQYSDWSGNLVSTNIDNFDLRWEKFMSRGQIYSVSTFYKSFRNPIELVRIPEQQTTAEFQPRNLGDAWLVGIEMEATRSLEILSEKLEKFSLSGNFTYVYSALEMSDREFNARKAFEKEGQDIDDVRPMAGQAPYVINFGVTYLDLEKGWQGGLFYNVKGPALEVVGTGLIPDVYQEPFHSLNLGLTRKLGENQNTAIDLNINNLLNDRRESFFQSFEAEEQIFTSFNPGTTLSLSVSHSF